MKFLRHTLLLLLLFPSSSSGQTRTNGISYAPSSGVSLYQFERPSDQIVRVVVPTGNGSQFGGTGVVISGNRVLTVSHVVRGHKGTILVRCPNGKTSRCTVAVSGKYVCVLDVHDDLGIKPVILAPDYKTGEEITLAGYGPGQHNFRSRRGRVIADSWQGNLLTVNAEGRNGDSGGPIWTERGLIGLIEGGGGAHLQGQTMGPDLAAIRAALKDTTDRTETAKVPADEPAAQIVPAATRWPPKCRPNCPPPPMRPQPPVNPGPSVIPPHKHPHEHEQKPHEHPHTHDEVADHEHPAQDNTELTNRVEALEIRVESLNTSLTKVVTHLETFQDTLAGIQNDQLQISEQLQNQATQVQIAIEQAGQAVTITNDLDARIDRLGFNYLTRDIDGTIVTPLTWMPVVDVDDEPTSENTLNIQKVMR